MSNRTVLVTGGASGLGAAVVQAIDEAGDHAVVLDRVRPATQADGAVLDHVVADLTDREATEEAVRLVAGDGLDGVVTCAGVDSCGPLDDVPADEWERVVDINLVGTVRVIRAALPALRRSHGRVVTVASTLGLRVAADATAYCASKFGVVGFTRALAMETAGDVGVTLIVPGGMDTPFFDGRDDQYKPPPDAKLNRPEDVARSIVFALSQPPGCEVRELVVTPSVESSWP
jgi:NAD(P)-dependent dehydrogenase (short-subunit alcohol dehydrogenase family)